jgi:N-methylhydantoinase B
MTANALDPITLGVIQNGFQQICNEMDLTFVRSAFRTPAAANATRSVGLLA